MKKIAILLVTISILFTNCQKISTPMIGCWENEYDSRNFMYFTSQDEGVIYNIGLRQSHYIGSDDSITYDDTIYTVVYDNTFYDIKDDQIVIDNQKFTFFVEGDRLTITNNDITLYFRKTKKSRKVGKEFKKIIKD